MLQKLTEQLRQGTSLDEGQVREAVSQLIEESVTPEVKADFLTALAGKRETVEEIAFFARELRDKSIPIPLEAGVRSGAILDVCGTGGDHLNTFNISTTVALVAAAAGVTVAKHGNRAVTSKSGSADVLEALGIRIDLSPEQAAQSLQQHQFAFLFAPRFHPAFKHVAPARKLCAQRGQRTLFNLLGPLLNPARPSAQLIGVPAPELCEPIARVLQMIGVQRGMVVSGEIDPSSDPESLRPRGSIRYLDELSTLGETRLSEFYSEKAIHSSSLGRDSFPMAKATLADLAGGDSHTNAEIVRKIFSGEERGPKRDAVIYNTAAAFLVAGKVKSIVAGWDLAVLTLESGAALRKLESLVEFSRDLAK